MKIALGQRWMYHDERYMWVLEITNLGTGEIYSARAKIVQMIKNPYAGQSNCMYNEGSEVVIDNEPNKHSDYYTLLEGQEAPTRMDSGRKEK